MFLLERWSPLENQENTPKNVSAPDFLAPRNPNRKEHLAYLEQIFHTAVQEYQDKIVSLRRARPPLVPDRGRNEKGELISPTRSEYVQEEARRLAQDLQNDHWNFENSTRLFALITATQCVLEPRHHPSWAQTKAALMIIRPAEGEIKRIQMGTGQGKTFVAAMAAIHENLRGSVARVHTDKHINVKEGLRKTKDLYEMLGVQTQYLNPQEDWKEYDKSKVYYGIWYDFAHVELHQRDNLARLRYVHSLPPQERYTKPEFLSYFFWLKGLEDQQLVPAIRNIEAAMQGKATWIVDEGDEPDTQSWTPVIITKPVKESIDSAERIQSNLIWKIVGVSPPESLARQLGQVFFKDDAENRGIAQFTLKVREHEQVDATTDVVLNQGEHVKWKKDRVYATSLFWLIEDAFLLSQALRSMEPHTLQLDRATCPFTKKQLKAVRKVVAQVEDRKHQQLPQSIEEKPMQAEHWQEVTHAFGPVPSDFFIKVLEQHPRLVTFTKGMAEVLRTLPKKEAGQKVIDEAAWQKLEEVAPGITARFGCLLMFVIMEKYWADAYSAQINKVMKTRYQFEENKHYLIKDTPQGKRIVVLSKGKEPEDTKEFDKETYDALCEKHGLPLPESKVTIDRMNSSTNFERHAYNGDNINILTGSAVDPDEVIESEGVNEITELKPRFFARTDEKLRAILEQVKSQSHRPILLCVQDPKEVTFFKQYIKEQPDEKGQHLLEITPQQAEYASSVISQVTVGSVVLLQITARGLDFGQPLEDGEHSMKNALVIVSSYMEDPHVEKQLFGRVGGNRPSGDVVVYTAFDDQIFRERQEINPQWWQSNYEEVQKLEEQYRILTSRYPNTAWPQTLGEVVATVQLSEDGQKNKFSSSVPEWLTVITQPEFQELIETFKKFTAEQLTTLKKQQRLNQKSIIHSRENNLAPDEAIQHFWQIIFEPTSTHNITPLESELWHLPYPIREKIWTRFLEVADDLFRFTLTSMKVPDLADDRTLRKMQFMRFGQLVSERIAYWVEEERIAQEYAHIKNSAAKFVPPLELPESLDELADWQEEKVDVLQNNCLKHEQKISAYRQQTHTARLLQVAEKVLEKKKSKLEKITTLPLPRQIFYDYLYTDIWEPETSPLHKNQAWKLAQQLEQLLERRRHYQDRQAKFKKEVI